MRPALAALLLGIALFVLSGPLFGLFGLLVGMDVLVGGGWQRVLIDLAVALLVLIASFRLWSGRRRHA